VRNPLTCPRITLTVETSNIMSGHLKPVCDEDIVKGNMGQLVHIHAADLHLEDANQL